MSIADDLYTYYVVWNNDTVLADRWMKVQGTGWLGTHDRLEKVFVRTFTLYPESQWVNYQGLTIAQRSKLKEITWNEAVALWQHPPAQPSPYKEDSK